MKKAFIRLIIFIVITSCTGCEYEEIDVPDICGIYTGARAYKALKDEKMSIDIKSISSSGLAGTITYSNSNQQYTTAFTGQWKESGSGADVYFYEYDTVEKLNVAKVPLFVYQGYISNAVIAGSCSFISSGCYNYEFNAMKTPPEAEVPIQDPAEPVLPDYE